MRLGLFRAQVSTRLSRRHAKARATSLVLLIASAAWAQPPSIKADGVPAVPAALLEELERYENGRTASFADWHPIKREMLISTRFGELPQAHHVAMPGGARTQLTFSSERKVSSEMFTSSR